MITASTILSILLATTAVSITTPVANETYTTDLLTVRAIVENDNLIPDSVNYTLNGESISALPKINTDWHTYMANNNHTGFSESSAPNDNTILWTAPITGDTHEFCSPIIVDEVVYYVSDQQSRAYALDALTGDIIWEYDVVDHVDDAATWYDDKVYIAADSAWCLDALTGAKIWAYKPYSSFKMNGSAVVEDDIAFFSFAPNWNSMEIIALDAQTGAHIWTTLLPAYSTGCITLNEGVVYAPTYDGNLYAIDADDGSILWENNESNKGYWDSTPVVVEGVVYINGFDGTARAIDAESGTTLWDSPLTTHYIAATPVYHENMLLFADQEATFHCLDASDGSTIWSVPGVQHGSSGAAEGIVFFGEGADRNYGKVRALSIETGAEVWSYQTGGTEIFSSPAITDGILYIAGMDWNLYAFGTGYKYTYIDDFTAQIGLNILIVSSFFEGVPVASDTVSFTVAAGGIDSAPTQLFNLSAAPNPFSASTAISFTLTEEAHTTVEVFDLSGRKITTLTNSNRSPGSHSLEWNGCSSSNTQISAGLYLCRVQSGNSVETFGICRLR